MCDHVMVRARQLDFLMAPCPKTGILVRKHAPYASHSQIVTGHTDGRACVRCGHFEPNEKPNA